MIEFEFPKLTKLTKLIRWLLRKPKCEMCQQRLPDVMLYKQLGGSRLFCANCSYLNGRITRSFGIELQSPLSPLIDKEHQQLQKEMKDVFKRKRLL